VSITINVSSGFGIFLFALVCGMGFEVGRAMIITGVAAALRLLSAHFGGEAHP
jgi:hypothetical protein